jgi:glycosyltransferase involved in cell wall biosynthesis
MKATRDTVLAIIPACSEERFIGEVVRRVLEYVGKVIVIDDGSPDKTAIVAEAAGAQVIRHPVNRGKGAAIKSGLKHASASEAQFFLFLDGDGQHDPADIPVFLRAMNESGADFIVGNRMTNLAAMPVIRRLTNKFMSWQIGAICKVSLPDSQCGFRLVRRELLQILNAPSEHFEFETESLILAARHGFRVESVPIRTIYTGQRSKIRVLRDTIRYARLITKFACSPTQKSHGLKRI